MSEHSIINQTQSEADNLTRRGYKLLKKLGEGTHAKVYLGEFLIPGSTATETVKLACKMIDTKKNSGDFLNKFLPRELEILTKIHHPHIIPVHSIFQHKSKYFIFMRHAEKSDLLHFVIEYGPIGENQARIWTRQLALAIQYLHNLDIAHRDLKCENVLLTSNYNIKVTDFGFARYVVNERKEQVLSSTYCGSLQYAAPEILKGRPYAPKISDMWAFGVIIFTITNKSMPFAEDNPKKLHDKQITRKWTFRSRVVDRLSEKLKNLVRSLLEPNTKLRWVADKVADCEWIQMDSRLLHMTDLEMAALNSAKAYIMDKQYASGTAPDVERTTATFKRSSMDIATKNRPVSNTNVSVPVPTTYNDTYIKRAPTDFHLTKSEIKNTSTINPLLP